MKNIIIALLVLIPLLVFGQEPITSDYGVFLKGIAKESTLIFQEPNTGSRDVGSREPFEIVYLFETDSGDKLQNGFYRVGYEPTKPRGWIEEEKITEWDNRICLKFSPLVGRQPALIWESREDVEDAVRGAMSSYDSNGVPNTGALAQEPGDMSKNRYSMLLPALERKEFTTSGEIKKVYKVGFLTGGQNQTKKIIPPTKGPSAFLEVVFLIDATASMGDYIEGAKEVAKITSKRVSNMIEGGVNLGVTVYRDYVSDQSGMGEVTEKIVPLTKNINNVIDGLASIYEAEVTSEDFVEAGFDGLFTAATETKWNETKSSLRVIVWIGDASAHPPGSPKNPFNFSLETILNQCSESRVRIVGIKIKRGIDDDALHIEQMERLTQGKEASDKGYFEIVEEGLTDQIYIDQLSGQIESEISRMQSLVKVVKVVNQGGGSTSGSMSNISVSDKAIILKNLKVTAGSQNTKPFNEGWIREISPEQNIAIVEEHVYMTRDEMDLLITYLNASNQVIESPESKVIQTMADVVSTQSGDKLDQNGDLSKHYEKRFGLPATSNLLKFTLDQVKDMGDEKLKRLHEQIKAKTKFLRSHKEEDDNWFTIPGTSLRYTFVPLSQLP